MTVWFALTGRLPFAGKTIEEIREQQTHHPLPLEQLKARAVPDSIIDLLCSCLALDPAKRPASAGELMQAIESCRNQSVKRGWFRRFAPFVLVLAALMAALSAFFFMRPTVVPSARPQVSARPIEKGIAVLPFENLSAEKEDAFFTDGIQDDVLTSVGKIKGLKVIARASVLDYRGARLAGKVREIGTTLGVSHVLEGSVRRVIDRVVVNVALIDTRDERQVWSERYERTLTDTISLQGDLAIEIARALQATLTPAEAMVAATRPTQNPEAYLFYLRAREMDIRTHDDAPEELKGATQLYQQAIDLDPNFALARARLSLCANRIGHYFPTPWIAKARTEADEALRLRPELGEARLALTHCYLWGNLDYDRALEELNRAADLLPNSAEVPLTAAFIYKRQNRFRDRIAALNRAEALDPRSRRVLGFLLVTQHWVREWPEALHTFDRLVALAPDIERCGRANDEFRMSGDINVLKKAIADSGQSGGPAKQDWPDVMRYELAVFERDYAEAARYLSALPEKAFLQGDEPAPHSKAVHEAFLTLAANPDAVVRQQALIVARDETEKRFIWKDGLPNAKALADLALLYAFLGQKEEAIRKALRAVELASAGSIEKNDYSSALAMVYAHVGEPEKAIDLIEHLLTVPGDLQGGAVYNMTLTDLKWRWQWDPLRSIPRFQKILAGPEPKTAY